MPVAMLDPRKQRRGYIDRKINRGTVQRCISSFCGASFATIATTGKECSPTRKAASAYNSNAQGCAGLQCYNTKLTMCHNQVITTVAICNGVMIISQVLNKLWLTCISDRSLPTATKAMKTLTAQRISFLL